MKTIWEFIKEHWLKAVIFLVISVLTFGLYSYFKGKGTLNESLLFFAKKTLYLMDNR